VFSISDIEARTKIIEKWRELEDTRHGLAHREVASARQILARGQQELDNQPWLSAGAIAVAAVAGGGAIAGPVGAVAGAAFGFFMAQGYLSNIRAERRRKLSELEGDLDSCNETLEDNKLRPRYFSLSEAISANEDKHFGLERAFARRLQTFSSSGLDD
jgi:hypothetical protein